VNGYFGTLGRKLQGRNVTVGEYFYPGRYRIGTHSHARAYLSVILRGDYRETVETTASDIAGRTVIVHRPGESHHEVFGERGATILSIDMPADWFDPVLERSRTIYTGPDVDTAIGKLARELKSDGSAAEWFVESAVLNLVGIVVRRSERRQPEASWLRRVTAYLDDTYARNTPLAELAALAGVHPVCLARCFREVHRCTVGEYVRALRLEHALADLVRSKKPIAEIAVEHGFSDQSHLTRQVRLATGITPRQWRVTTAERGR
jgi:AraC family transcriptional regulator